MRACVDVCVCVCVCGEEDRQSVRKQRRQFLTERRGREAAASSGGVMGGRMWVRDLGSEGLRRNTQAREKQKAQEPGKFMVFECQKSCHYEMSLEREAAGHSELGGLLRSVDAIPGAMENRSREEHDQISVFKSSHCLLLLWMDFRETKAELRSPSRNRPPPGRKWWCPQGKDI